MSRLGTYCKAIPITQLRAYSGWTEPEGRRFGDDDILFLQEGYAVTDNIYIDEGVVFNRVTEEWKEFCTGTLGFQPPDPEFEPN
jgi:hypothetical protein